MIDLNYGALDDEEEEDDPDVIEDPLHQLDLRTHLQEFLVACVQNGAVWSQLSAGMNSHEVQVVTLACTS